MRISSNIETTAFLEDFIIIFARSFSSDADTRTGDSFFSAFDFDEASLAVSELHAAAFGNEFVKRLLIRAFEKDDMARENACRLLSSLELSPLKIGQGFLALFESLNEVEKDAPMAREFAARFLARAVSDEILPPSFVTDEFTRRIAGLVVDDAIVLFHVFSYEMAIM
jgi:programmed cell death protein 4